MELAPLSIRGGRGTLLWVAVKLFAVRLRQMLGLLVAALIVSVMPTTQAQAGTYTLLFDGGAHTAQSLGFSEGSVNATYYRGLTLSFNANATGAFLGYIGGDYFNAFISGSQICTKCISEPGSNGQYYSFGIGGWNGNSNVQPSFQWGTGFGHTLSIWNIQVTGIKDAPWAGDHGTYTVAKNGASGWIGISNVSDPQGAPMTAHLGGGPSHGTVSWSGNSFYYTPYGGYVGGDSFSYYMTENVQGQGSNWATVYFNVVNAAPWANDSYYTINEDSGTGWVGLNVGDSDGSISSMTVGSTYMPGGSWGTNGVSSFWYNPPADWNGVAWFDFYVTDDNGATSPWRRAYITVNAVNDAPWANDSYYTISEDSSTGLVNLNVGDVDGNLSDCPTGSYSLPGSFSRSGCSFTFTPNADWNGVAWFDFYAIDTNSATSAWRRAYITVNAVNDPPTLNPLGNVTVGSYKPFTVSLSGITAGPADEVQTLTVTATSSNPALIPNPVVTYTSPQTTGTLTLTPVHGVRGSTTITVTVNDGIVTTNRTFTVTSTFVYLLHR